MHLTLQLVTHADNGDEDTVHEVAVLEKKTERLKQLGLTLAKAKQLRKTLRQYLLGQQVTAFLATRSSCEACGTPLRSEGQHTRTFRTLFGTITLPNPRLYHCRCPHRNTTTFRPLMSLLTETTIPELPFMAMKWASLVSYELTLRALKDFLPVDATPDMKTVQNHTLEVAQR
jgi:hypothetical protein